MNNITVFSVISVIVLFSYVITQTKIRNTKYKRMHIHSVNVYGKGSPRTKITLHENLKFEKFLNGNNQKYGISIDGVASQGMDELLLVLYEIID